MINFDIGAQGFVNIKASEKTLANAKPMLSLLQTTFIKATTLTEPIIAKMKAEALKFKEDDIKQKERNHAKNVLEDAIFEARNLAETSRRKEFISQIIDQVADWLDKNPYAEIGDYTVKNKEFSKELLIALNSDTKGLFLKLTTFDSCR